MSLLGFIPLKKGNPEPCGGFPCIHVHSLHLINLHMPEDIIMLTTSLHLLDEKYLKPVNGGHMLIRPLGYIKVFIQILVRHVQCGITNCTNMI